MSWNRLIGIDKLHVMLNKHILLAEKYSEIHGLTFIIRACRLKPYDIVFRKHGSRIVLHRCWIDEYGNSLNIVRRSGIKILHNDLSINKSKLPSTDLYEGLSIEKIASISKLAFILVGKTFDTYDDHIVISFLGIDNHLRTFVYLDGIWSLQSSLCLGLKVLQQIARNVDVKHFKKLKQNKPVVYPCVKQQIWVSFWPPSKELESVLEEHCGKLLSQVINGEKNVG
jgi:hypothetical protein